MQAIGILHPSYYLPGPGYSPDKDIPDLTGKVIIVTGGNTGIGFETVQELAKHNPDRIYLAARTESKAMAAIEILKRSSPTAEVRFLQLDLCSLDSVREASSTFLAQEQRLDILVNNAGIMATPPGLTNDGFEIQLGTNHLGHFLLTQLLLPTLLSTSQQSGTPSRVVTVSSGGHHLAPPAGIHFEGLSSSDGGALTRYQRYGQSKLANILFARTLAKRNPSLISVAVHPGIVKTDLYASTKEGSAFIRQTMALFSDIVMKTAREGSFGQLWAATAVATATTKKGVESGEFYLPVGRKFQGSTLSRDEELADRLWTWSENQVVKSS